MSKDQERVILCLNVCESYNITPELENVLILTTCIVTESISVSNGGRKLLYVPQ
jgi:hypothetical protein